MSFTKRYLWMVERWLPSPLAIALWLTVFTALLAWIFTETPENELAITFIGNAWKLGFWELLEFTMQMMIMLVLGHTIALSVAVDRLIKRIISFCNSNAKAAVLVATFSILMGFVNWGLGLIFGAILARKVAEHAQREGLSINYPLIGACGYLALLVWHGGLSGSAPLTVAQVGHSLEQSIGIIPISETLFSAGNIFAFFGVLLVLPTLAFALSKGNTSTIKNLIIYEDANLQKEELKDTVPMDSARWPGMLIGIFILLFATYQFISLPNHLTFFNLNNVNFLLFGVALLIHGSLNSFTNAAEKAIIGSTGILIQFPLYAGIMGIMKYTGLLVVFATSFTSISTVQTFPALAYLSSALVNIFVPSGGGQWQIQGPILVETASLLGVSMNKVVLALAYGDQLTNMLQPFWALPLLGITGLKAKEILPYSIIFMIAAGFIYLAALYLL